MMKRHTGSKRFVYLTAIIVAVFFASTYDSIDAFFAEGAAKWGVGRVAIVIIFVISSSKTASGEDEKAKMMSSSSKRPEFEDEISRQARNDKGEGQIDKRDSFAPLGMTG